MGGSVDIQYSPIIVIIPVNIQLSPIIVVGYVDIQ